MPRRRALPRPALHLAVGLVAVLVALAARAGDVLQPLELDTVDARFALRGDHASKQGIVIVALDGRTLGELGLRPPLPRSLHAPAPPPPPPRPPPRPAAPGGGAPDCLRHPVHRPHEARERGSRSDRRDPPRPAA